MALTPTTSARDLDGYFWTVQDKIIQFCTCCAQTPLTYCEINHNDKSEARVCCAHCQRILSTLVVE